jgi:hypothetical protein
MNPAPADHPANPQSPALLLDLAAEPAAGDISRDELPAWQQVATGRYMPRRIRGSYRGGVLG